jgi:hypothetical protein
MNTTDSKPTIKDLLERVENVENAVAELRADYFGRMAAEDEKPKRIDMSPAYGETGGLVYHPDDEPTQAG